MSVFDSIPTTPVVVRASDPLLDDAQLAAVAFLARYSGRTLESYRADLRQYLGWTASVGLRPLAATRAHIELYRAWMEERGLAASTVDRRLSTVCGYYRFAHLDGRIPANPASWPSSPAADSNRQRPPSTNERGSVRPDAPSRDYPLDCEPGSGDMGAAPCSADRRIGGAPCARGCKH